MSADIPTMSSACPSLSPVSNSDTSFSSDVVSPAMETPPFAKDLPLALRRAHRSNAGLRKEPYILLPEKFETSLSKTKDLKITLKRKLDTSHTNKVEKKKHVGDREDYVPSSRKKKKIPKKLRDQDSSNDFYCWICHREGSMICCELCPRVYHSRCLQLKEDPDGDWFCPECQKIMKAECVESQSRAMAMLSVDQLSRLLIFSLQRMKHSWAQPFMKPVDVEAIPDYYEYIFHPMDLSTLEKNIKSKKYGSTDAFLADAKWILHNCIVYNGSNHKLTNNAKMIIKICKHEMSEIEVCEDCYLASCIKRDHWFCEPCREPHTLVWARLQGFPFWPAKALQTKKGQVDVRFFGQHDRAWVPVPNCYKISEEIPCAAKKKTNGLNSAITEMGLHIEKIRKKFGKFDYAPHRTPYDPRNTKLKKYNSLATAKTTSSKSSKIMTSSMFRKSMFLSIKKEPLDESNKLIIVDDEVSLKLPTSTVVESNNAKETGSINKKSKDSRKLKHSGSSTANKKKPIDIQNPGDRKTKDTERLNDNEDSDSKKSDNPKDIENTKTAKQSDVGKPNDNCKTTGNSKDIEKANSTMKKEANMESSADKSILEKMSDLIRDGTKELEPEEMTKTLVDKQETDVKKGSDDVKDISEDKPDQNYLSSTDDKDASESKQSTSIASVEISTDELKTEKKNKEVIDEKNEDVTENVTEQPSDKTSDKAASIGEDTKNMGKEIEDQDNGKNENADEKEFKMDTSTDNEKPTSKENEEMDSSKEKMNKEGLEYSDKEKTKKREKNSQSTPKRNMFMEKLGRTIESCKAILGLNSEVEDKDEEMQSESESEESESDSDSSDEDIEEIGYEVRRKRSCSSEEAMDVDDNSAESSGKISPTVEDNVKRSSSSESKNEKSAEESVKPETAAEHEKDDNVFEVNENIKPVDSAGSKLQTATEDDNIDSVFDDNTPKVEPVDSTGVTQPTEPIQNGMDAVLPMSVENSELNPNKDDVDTKQNEDMGRKEDDTMEVDVIESENHQKNSRKLESNETAENTDLKIELNERKKEANLENDDVFDHVKDIVDLGNQETPGNKQKDDAKSVKTPDSAAMCALSKIFGDDAGNKPHTSKDEKTSAKYGHIAAKIRNFDKYIGKVSDVVKETLIEMYSEVAEDSVEDETKKVMKGFQEEVDFLKWRHTRELEEFKHVAALTIAEMRSTFDHDKSKALETLTKQMEAEKQKAIELTKKKQWCANCVKEAVFYCCWNTSYCDYPCQQRHWPTHMKTCQQLGSADNSDKSPKNVIPIQTSVMKPNVPHPSDPMMLNNQPLVRPHPVQIIPASSTNPNKLQTLIQYVQAAPGTTLQAGPMQGNNPQLPSPNPGGLYRLEPVQHFPVLRPQNLRNMVGPGGQPMILRPNMLHHLPNVNQRL